MYSIIEELLSLPAGFEEFAAKATMYAFLGCLGASIAALMIIIVCILRGRR